MISEVLLAAAPGNEHMAVFEPLIGSWSLVVENIADDGTVQTVDGEWHFGWGLNGRALLDVWISPSRAAGATGEWGLSVRFHDPAIGAFRSTWHGPARGWVIPFTAEPTDDGMALVGAANGTELRWVFSELTADSFEWRAEETRPGATEPFVRQRFHARRSADQPDPGVLTAARD